MLRESDFSILTKSVDAFFKTQREDVVVVGCCSTFRRTAAFLSVKPESAGFQLTVFALLLPVNICVFIVWKQRENPLQDFECQN